MMRNLALTTALVSCNSDNDVLDWSTNGDSDIYAVLVGSNPNSTQEEFLNALMDVAEGTGGCTIETAEGLHDATFATAKMTVNAVCDAVDEATLAVDIAANIGSILETIEVWGFCQNPATAKSNYSAAAAKVLYGAKADMDCPETSAASTVSVMAAIAALAIRLL